MANTSNTPSGASARSSESPQEPDGVDLFETVDWSCCCCSRRIGVLVLGVSSFCISVTALVLCILGILEMQKPFEPELKYDPTKWLKNSNQKMQPHPNIMKFVSVLEKESEEMVIRAGLRILMILQATVAGMGIFNSVLLIWGAWKMHPFALLPWLANTCLEIVFLIGGAIYCLVMAISRKLPLLQMDGFFVLVFMFLFCLPVAYCILAVATFYRELNKTQYKRFVHSPNVPKRDAEQNRAPPRPEGGPPLPPGNQRTPIHHINPAYESTSF